MLSAHQQSLAFSHSLLKEKRRMIDSLRCGMVLQTHSCQCLTQALFQFHHLKKVVTKATFDTTLQRKLLLNSRLTPFLDRMQQSTLLIVIPFESLFVVVCLCHFVISLSFFVFIDEVILLDVKMIFIN
jgi:hypothetical protein